MEPGPTDGSHTLTIRGDFECKGVIHEIDVLVTLSYLPGQLGDRMGGEVQGDLLVLRSSFAIKRVDYNIKPEMGFAKVANTINLQLAITGQAEQSDAEATTEE